MILCHRRTGLRRLGAMGGEMACAIVLSLSPPPAAAGGGDRLQQPLAAPLESIPAQLTPRDALSLALVRNPRLAAVAREIHARKGAVRQAGLPPNPVLNVQSSNLGNPALKRFDGPNTTLKLSQLILLGGKLSKGVRLAELDQELAGWDYRAAYMNVATTTVQAFIEVLKDQSRLALADQLVGLAERVLEVVGAQVRAGKVSPVQATRARVNLASVKIDRRRIRQALEAARKRLAAAWGSTEPGFERVLGKLDHVAPIPARKVLIQRLQQNPDLARWASEIARRRAALELAESRAIPDLKVSVGATQFHDAGETAVMAGLSLPLAIFNRNQGQIEETRQRLVQAEEGRVNAEVTVTTALNTAYRRLAAAHAEVTTLKEQVIPGARSAFEAIQKGYRRGKFGLMDVLDTQRTWFDARQRYLAALADYHQAVAEVERLIGEPLDAAHGLEESK
ncbi:TolC family protein [Methylohalobius crimeensis]|uniref:TolC family protein n=1 Tax=Methylohalobius crimeensis TaxID=244365 RepID=UPI0003FAAA85|nr:TolC family protein [Methylohalobius crimeensis]